MEVTGAHDRGPAPRTRRVRAGRSGSGASTPRTAHTSRGTTPHIRTAHGPESSTVTSSATRSGEPGATVGGPAGPSTRASSARVGRGSWTESCT